jgi:GT2 family glycosyltransferase
VIVGARVLLLITVYNGRGFVGRCLESARRLSAEAFDLDVLVLDDASPEPGWSSDLESLCTASGFGYYCTPRNLGIPRNVSLGLAVALEGDYTHVVISNSDVIYAENSIAQLLECVTSDPKIGSATAYSTNVSIYSIPNSDPDTLIAEQPIVDWIGATLAGAYGSDAIDGPAGISFSMMIPVPVLREVGLMDPVFGRGYCEETDWSLRSKACGYRITIAPGAFVYHEGGGSNIAAGLLQPGQTSVPSNERVIDLRYPLFRAEVSSFLASGILDELHRNSQAEIVRQGGRQFGYVVRVGWLPRLAAADVATVMVDPSGSEPAIIAQFRGFSATIPAGNNASASIRGFFGTNPAGLDLLTAGPHSQDLRSEFPDLVGSASTSYPERV